MSTDQRLALLAEELAGFVRKKAGKSATHVLVGPALIYGDDEKLASILVVGRPGHAGLMIRAVLGAYETELDPNIARHFDTIIRVSRADGLAKREADNCRLMLIEQLKRVFQEVTPCDDDLALATANAALFPSPEARKVLRDIQADKAQGS